MSVREYISQKIKEEGRKYGENYILEGYDERIEELSKIAINKIVEQANEDSGDVPIRYKNKKYIAEICHTYTGKGIKEIDISIISEKEYEDKYGHKYGEGF